MGIASRVETRQLPRHCGDTEKSDVCRSVRIWQDRSAHEHDRRTSTQDRGARQANGAVDCLDPGSSPRLHFLGAVRTESNGAERECLHEITHGPEDGSWGPQLVDRLVALSALRADAEYSLQWTGGKPAVLPLSLYHKSCGDSMCSLRGLAGGSSSRAGDSARD